MKYDLIRLSLICCSSVLNIAFRSFTFCRSVLLVTTLPLTRLSPLHPLTHLIYFIFLLFHIPDLFVYSSLIVQLKSSPLASSFSASKASHSYINKLTSVLIFSIFSSSMTELLALASSAVTSSSELFNSIIWS